MDGRRFDAATRGLGRVVNRRGAVGLAAALTLLLAEQELGDGPRLASAKHRRCKPSSCPVNEFCKNSSGCSCSGGESQQPFTCCGSIGKCVAPSNSGFLDPLTCENVTSCPAGTTPCSGTTCKVCCPKGTKCQPTGWCKGQPKH